MRKTTLLVCFAASLLAGALAVADDTAVPERYSARLAGFSETPPVSTTASGRFTATVDEAAQTITYELSYEGLQGTVTQSHIHFGTPFATGGIMIWLCQTATNPAPAAAAATTPVCPSPSAGAVSGSVIVSGVIAIGAQGIAAGEFAEAVRAIRAGLAYANVHSTLFPPGEIRGTLKRVRGRGDRDD